MNSRTKRFLLFCFLIACSWGGVQIARAETIHRAMQRNIREIVEYLAAMLRGTQPDELPQNADALRRQIRTAGREGSQTRGLIVQGAQEQSKIRAVKFNPDLTPIMSVTLTCLHAVMP